MQDLLARSETRCAHTTHTHAHTCTSTHKQTKKSIVSGVGRGRGTGETSPLPRKNCCRKMVLSSRGIYVLSRQRQKSSKKCRENLWKSQFSIEILIKKSQNFLFGLFCPNAQNFASRFLSFPCLLEIICQMLIILYFSTNYIQISPKISRILTPLPIFLLDLSHFWIFW